MKSGYDQFFKKARKAAESGALPKRAQVSGRRTLTEQQLKNRMGIKSSSKRSFPFLAVFICVFGVGASVAGLHYRVKLETLAKNIEVSFLAGAFAEETPASVEGKNAKEKTSADGTKKDAGKSEEKASDSKNEAKSESESKPLSADEVDHLRKLNDRKAELDAKEEELNRMEQELQTQKAALEKRMTELEDTRRKISSVLDDRVKADDQKIESLVQLYTNMRPPQAAKVFETLDEDLTVEVLSRMKKKNAADIMNLLKPEKAQVVSEKLAGYKRSK